MHIDPRFATQILGRAHDGRLTIETRRAAPAPAPAPAPSNMPDDIVREIEALALPDWLRAWALTLGPKGARVFIAEWKAAQSKEAAAAATRPPSAQRAGVQTISRDPVTGRVTISTAAPAPSLVPPRPPPPPRRAPAPPRRGFSHLDDIDRRMGITRRLPA